MRLAVEFGIDGLGAVVLLVIGLALTVEAVRPRIDHRWWRAALCVGALFFLALSAGAFWEVFHIRTVRFTVDRLIEEHGGHPKYFVRDTHGNEYEADLLTYVMLHKGERVTCRMTTPPALFVSHILSCVPGGRR